MAASRVYVKIDELRDLMERLLKATACDPHDSKIIANVFLEADLRGNNMQGLDHMATMLRNLRNGNMNPKGKPKIVNEGAAFARIDGARGPGQLAAILAGEVATRKVRDVGIALVGITNSADIYMVGFYTEQIARAGFVAFGFSTGGPFAHAAGGAEPALGTNPISIAIPRLGDDPLLVDMATSSLSGSRVRFAGFLGELLPEGTALGPDGRQTRDPQLARIGGLETLGGHKGFGLSLCTALLSGPLTGSDVGNALAGWGFAAKSGISGSMGHLFLAIDPAVFTSSAQFRDSVERYINEIKSTRKAPGTDAIRVPGERAFDERRRNLATGVVSIYEFIWTETTKIATELGVIMPALN